MTRPAPSVDAIVALAAHINDLALRGFTASLPEEAQHQLYTAIPGAPGEGLRLLEDALHPALRMRTVERGDLLFWKARATDAKDMKR